MRTGRIRRIPSAHGRRGSQRGRGAQPGVLPPGTDAEPEQGQPIEFEADFFRWFTGPGSGDPVEVRYLAADPSEAVLSWQAGAVWQQYASGALMVLGIGGLCLWGAWLLISG